MTQYIYQNDGICPFCGGTVVEEDGWIICNTPGICTWCVEVKDAP